MKVAFGVKSARLDALAIQLQTDDLEEIRLTLHQNIEKYRKFQAMPFILDVSALESGEHLNLTDIIAAFAIFGLSVVGLRHHNPEWVQYALKHGLSFSTQNSTRGDTLNQNEKEQNTESQEFSLDSDSGSEAQSSTEYSDTQENQEQEKLELELESEKDDDILANDNDAIKTVEMAKMAEIVEIQKSADEPNTTLFNEITGEAEDNPMEDPVTLMPSKPTIVVSTPVRTGQQVYAEHADLIVLGTVSPGAEVIADGNIHIYAPLKGRALAGASGDVNARIFVQSMQAELVSIAGIYRVFEQKLPDHLHRKAVQIELQNDRLAIGSLNIE